MIGVLPMRDSVLFPGLIQTILVGRPMSIRTLERAMQDESPVFVVLQRSPDIEVPEPPTGWKPAPSLKSCTSFPCRMATCGWPYAACTGRRFRPPNRTPTGGESNPASTPTRPRA
ncbi:hypothetical protein CCB81_08050 [Armatimonadetes bacterium Uphvl-Ar2]|nr:hypothetical protein CCB81_08050 [Armatimonadetes bacterium Uphvl-Ar2]